MKFLPSQFFYFLRDRPSRLSILSLLRFILLLILLITVFSALFHYIMAHEGRSFSWMTGFYWVLTVMSTLGFGDITFESDLGRFYSSVVLLSGVIFLLIVLPFTFIEFFYAPWMHAQAENRAPTRLPEKTEGHVILTSLGPVTNNLINKLKNFHYEYVLIIGDLNEALRLHDMGFRVMRGDLDSPETYRRARADHARLIAATGNDMLNTNIVSTVREVSETVPIISVANHRAGANILGLAGSDHVLQLGEMLGQALARRVRDDKTRAHVIDRFDALLIAEAPLSDEPPSGQTVRESNLRQKTGVTLLGVWQRGKFEIAGPDTLLAPGTVLVMAGRSIDIARYNQAYDQQNDSQGPVVVIGGGRIGRAVGRDLDARGVDYRIIERDPGQIRTKFADRYVLGDASEQDTLEKAGIMETGTVVISTHDDDINIYLTIYCRHLRPDVRIVSRATLERNIATLHRAGADFVMSYATMGANAILTLLGRSDVLMVTEGLDALRVPAPEELAGRTLAEIDLRRRTGITVIAWQTDGTMTLNPDPNTPIPADAELILIGSQEAEQAFLDEFKAS